MDALNSVVDQPWFALQVRTRYEKTAAAVLRSKGYSEFLPLQRVRRRWSDRTVETEVPLFPGYVFCRFDPQDRRVPILTTPGVLGVVGFDGHAAPVRDCQIESIRRLLASGLLAEPWPFLAAGDRVRIDAGPLAGVEGFVVEAKNAHRLVLSVSLLQRSVSVEIDRSCTRPA